MERASTIDNHDEPDILAGRMANALDRLRAGDLAGYDLIFASVRNSLHARAARICHGNPDVAEDVVSKIWLKCRRIPNDSIDAKGIVAYLFTAVRNAAIDELSKAKRAVPIDENLSNIATPVSLHWQTALLPEPLGLIAELRFSGRLTDGEIAAWTGLSQYEARFHRQRAARLLAT